MDYWDLQLAQMTASAGIRAVQREAEEIARKVGGATLAITVPL